MSYVMGVDTGGTFTDCVVVGNSGELEMVKVPSSEEGTSAGVHQAVRQMAERLDQDPEELLNEVSVFAHGQTAALNTLLTRTGARTGLITTKGHEDAILIGRAHQKTAGLSQDEIKDPAGFSKPEPLVPRNRIESVHERIDYKGEVLVSLEESDARRTVESLLDKDVEAIAVSLLWAFKNPTHERRLKNIIQEMSPRIFVTLSSDLVPVIGEYERTATTVVNSYVGPKMNSYFTELEDSLSDLGLSTEPLIMQGGGGVIGSRQAAEQSVKTLNSGPIGGVIASRHIGKELDYSNIITTDMGGTSFDVGVLARGEATYNKEPVVNQLDLAIPSVDIHSVGAGGGSIAWVEEDTGLLRVGPQGAGANPGPACYGRGGERPTVTDADLVLGYINEDYFLGGEMDLSHERAREAIDRYVCRETGDSVVEAAAGINRIVNAQMADLVRKVTIEKGYDPENFSLFMFGGAGPVHGVQYGKELGVESMVVPAMSPAFSALGIALSDVLQTRERSEPMPLLTDPDRVNELFRTLEDEVIEELRSEGFSRSDIHVSRRVTVRYRRQIHNQVTVTVPSARSLSNEDLEDIGDRFEGRYTELYGRGSAYREAGKEMVTFRVDGRVETRKPELHAKTDRDRSAGSVAPHGTREAYFKGGGFISTEIYRFEGLRSGDSLSGPAIIEAPSTNVVIPPDVEASIDDYRNVRLREESK